MVGICITPGDYVITCEFFIGLMSVAWIMSCYWASKYNKLKEEQNGKRTKN